MVDNYCERRLCILGTEENEDEEDNKKSIAGKTTEMVTFLLSYLVDVIVERVEHIAVVTFFAVKSLLGANLDTREREGEKEREGERERRGEEREIEKRERARDREGGQERESERDREEKGKKNTK